MPANSVLSISSIQKHVESIASENQSHSNGKHSGTIQKPYEEKFYKSIMDQKKEYPLPVPVVSIIQNGEALPFLTLKSFSLWQGKQKSMKTTALALLVAAFIRGENDCIGTHFKSSMQGTVLFFDNEQGESYAARTMKLILKIAGVETSSKLIYCDLREFTPTERKKVIEAGIECTQDVKLVVIDGLVDLLNDFMDAGEGHLTTTDIVKLCSVYNIHVAGVLHQNKNDKNARAHIGTISSQKCEVEISTEIDPDDKNQSLVMCASSRGIPFTTFAIRWDKGSLPCISEDWSTTKTTDVKAAKNYAKQREIVESIFKPLQSFTHSEAVCAIQDVTLKGETTAKTYLKNYLGWGFIAKGDDNLYRINSSLGSGVNEGQNRVS